jgi:hypothetical protein
MNRKLILYCSSVFVLLTLISCGTTTFIKDVANKAGEDYNEGNYISGTLFPLLSIGAIPVRLGIDAITLGGALTMDQSASIISGTVMNKARGYDTNTSVVKAAQDTLTKAATNSSSHYSSPSGGYSAPNITATSGSKTISTAGNGNCPQDASAISNQIKTKEVRSGVSQPISELIQRGGGESRAIAMLSAQKEKYKDDLDQAAQAAKSSYGGAGDPLAFNNCPSPEGIYCSSNYRYWMAKDAVNLTDYHIGAIECYQNLNSQ